MSHHGQPVPDIATGFQWRSSQVSYAGTRFSRHYGSFRRGDAASQGLAANPGSCPHPRKRSIGPGSCRSLSAAVVKLRFRPPNGGWIQLKVP
jgi:hypothetical protein